MKILQPVLLLMLVGLLASCAPQMQPALQFLDTGSAMMAGDQYLPKVDNFEVIIDASLSMNDEGKNNFLKARDLVRRINQGIPAGLHYTAGLRSIGHSGYQSKNPTDLLYGMSDYNRNDFHAGLAKIHYTGGVTPMAAGLTAAGDDFKSTAGKSALIIVSDGLHMDTAPAAAQQLKKELGANLCIYTIAVGDSGSGHKMLKKIADAGQCGYATTEAALADAGKLNGFIQDVFLAPKPKMAAKPAPKPAPVKMAPRDSDGDGVTDDKDQCPTTPAGELVDEQGCSLKLTLHINFAHDKYDIKPEFKPELDRAAAYIKRYSQVPYIMLAGHTDSDGTVEYNQKLSENRANAVRDYLIRNYGIKSERLIARGFGELQPVADNATKEGRYQNRRVEVICCAVKPM